MMPFFSCPAYFITGHAVGAICFYLFHRFVFHGKLGRWKLFKGAAMIHALHHAYPDKTKFYHFPMWAVLVIGLATSLVSLLNLPFGIGLMSFYALYARQHRRAHFGPPSIWTEHHRDHHRLHPKSNYSGVYPFIDRIFGTNVSHG